MAFTKVPWVWPSAIVITPWSVVTVVIPCEALLKVAVKVTLVPSTTLAVDKLTVVGLMVSVIWAVAVAVPIVICSKLPPVAFVIVAAKVEASR